MHTLRILILGFQPMPHNFICLLSEDENMSTRKDPHWSLGTTLFRWAAVISLLLLLIRVIALDLEATVETCRKILGF